MPLAPLSSQEPGQKIIDVETAAQMLQLVLPEVRGAALPAQLGAPAGMQAAGCGDGVGSGRLHVGSLGPGPCWRPSPRPSRASLLPPPPPPAPGPVCGGLCHVPDGGPEGLQEDQRRPVEQVRGAPHCLVRHGVDAQSILMGGRMQPCACGAVAAFACESSSRIAGCLTSRPRHPPPPPPFTSFLKFEREVADDLSNYDDNPAVRATQKDACSCCRCPCCPCCPCWPCCRCRCRCCCHCYLFLLLRWTAVALVGVACPGAPPLWVPPPCHARFTY